MTFNIDAQNNITKTGRRKASPSWVVIGFMIRAHRHTDNEGGCSENKARLRAGTLVFNLNTGGPNAYESLTPYIRT